MHYFLHTYKTEVGLSLISLLVGSIAFFGMYARAQSQGIDFVTLTGDASGYVTLASNLLEHHAFSFSAEAPFTPDSFRAPGYPLLLAGLFALTHDWLTVLVVQMILVSAAPLLLYLLLKPYHERAAWWAAFIFIFEPIRLFLSASLLSDAPFLCLLLLSLIALDWARRTRQIRYTCLAGCFLGVSILMRPIAMFLPLLYAIFIFVCIRPRMQALQAVALLLIAVSVCTVPWMVRNYRTFGSWQLASVGTANLVIYNAPAYLAYAPDTRAETVLRQFNESQAALPSLEALSLARSDAFARTFRDIIHGHELSYLLFHVMKTAPFFLTDGLRDTVRLFNVDIGRMPNISTALLKGDIALVLSYVASGGLPIGLLVLGVGFWGVVTALWALALVGIVRRSVAQPMVLLAMVLVLYFALLTGPVSSARYRLPVAGFLLFGAAYLCVRKATSHEPQSA